MIIQAIIFDFGGVLVQTVDYSGHRKWEHRLGMEEGELAKTVGESPMASRALVGEVTEDQLWDILAVRFGLRRAELHEFRRDYWSGTHLNVQLARYLAILHKERKTAILSNAWTGARKAIVRGYNLRRLVDAIIISSEEGFAKPDANIYRIAAEKLGISTEEAIFVDDAPRNVVGARAAGMLGIEFHNTSQTIAEIASLLD